MAGSLDIEELSEEQQNVLQQYTSMTDQSIDAAIPLLRRCQWNVQIAIARFFDGEPADPEPESPPPPQSSRRQETLLDSLSSSSAYSRVRFEPAPRVVDQSLNQRSQQAPFLVSVLLTPLNLLYALVSRSYSLLAYFFPFLPRLLSNFLSRGRPRASWRDTTGRRALSARDTAARFVREFEEEYGSNDIPFHENGYLHAYDTAKKELKYLILVLLSPEHDDTSSFVKETLLDQEVVTFLRDIDDKAILWAGNVQDSEAYQVASSMNCTKFPFIGLIVYTPSTSSMSLVSRISGPTPPETLVQKLQSAISQHDEQLGSERYERAQQQASRNIREAQNSAYERSLAQDRERARQRREAEAAKEREEQAAREREESSERYAKNLAQWKRWRAQSIRPEPVEGDREAVRISVRMPSGQRILRRFAPAAELEELYAFVECLDCVESKEDIAGVSESCPEKFEHRYDFRLVSPMPREVYDVAAGGTIKERIGRSGNLLYERVEEEEDSADEA